MRILLVDDSDAVRFTLGALLEDAGHEVVEADSLAAALARLVPGAAFDVAVVDLALGDGKGTELFAPLRTRVAPAPAIVLLSGEPSPELRGADRALEKAGDPTTLVAAIEEIGRAGKRP